MTGIGRLILLAMLGCVLHACEDAGQSGRVRVESVNETAVVENREPASPDGALLNSGNPLLNVSELEPGYPPFDKIQPEHFLPAFEQGMAEQKIEVEAIAGQTGEADFTNTVVALELSGQNLDRISAIFNNLVRAHSNESLRALQQQVTQLLAAHDDSIVHNGALFARIQILHQQRDTLGLDAESRYLLEQYYRDFVRAGAMLGEEEKRQLREINAEIALLQTRISQNILLESNRLAIVVQNQEDLAGLSGEEIAAAADRARSEGLESGFVFSLQNTTQQPLLSSLENQQLREYIMQVSLSRNSNGGDYDNRELLSRLLLLRAQKARLLGYENYADFVLETQTAGSTEAVNARLADLVAPAVKNVLRDAQLLQNLIDNQGARHRLSSWDWEYYAEDLIRQENTVDSQQLRPYFELDNVLMNGVFFAASQLYGLSFRERVDLPVYHDDVRVFEVLDATGATLALFIADYLQRPSKRGGAWSSSYLAQSRLLGARPIVANHMNIPPAASGEAVLLTVDEVKTMFHEFGHALHNMLSDVQYPYFSGSRVPRDFVEFPSQVNEMWAVWPEVLANYAVHYRTGEPMPQELSAALRQSNQFNQGYATTEYLAASLLDMALHELAVEQIPAAEELVDFESRVLAQFGIDSALVPPRYRVTYFNHIMGGYAAGYYSYIWAEMLDADTVEWFRANGGLTRENGSYFRATLLSRGGSMDAMALYRNFRGQEASIQPLLERRGLIN